MPLNLGPLFDSHPLPQIVHGVEDLRIVAANRAAAAFYGRPVEALCGLSRLDLLEPGQEEALRAVLRALDEGGDTDPARRPPPRVWRERHADGRVLEVDVHSLPLDASGHPLPPNPGWPSPLRLCVLLDARPRTAQQAASRELAELFSVAERVAHVGGWRLDLDTGVVSRTAEAWAIHGLTPPAPDPRGGAATYPSRDLQNALDAYPGEARHILDRAVRECAQSGKPFELELPFVDAQARSRWVRAAGVPVRDAQGQVVALQGAIQDITPAKQAEIALRASQERLRATMAALPDLLFVFDAEDRHLEVSDPQHPSLSDDWEKKVGRRMGEGLEDPAHSRMFVDSARIARETGRPHAYLYQMRVRSGELRHFEGRTVPMAEGRVLTLVRDITTTIHLEQRFRRLADAVPIAIYETDAAGHVRYVNPQWQRLYCLTDEEATGDGWTKAIHPEDLPAVVQHFRAAVQAGAPYSHENRIVCPAGRERRVRVDSIPVLDDGGQVSCHVGVVVDITQARELDEARRAREVAEEAQRRQAAFLSRLSHELRTPLNAIIGFTELLMLAEMDQVAQAGAEPAPAATAHPQRGARLAHVRDAGKHMLALVNDLLELQRLQQSPTLLRPETVDLSDALHGCAAMLEPLARSRRVSLVVETDERSIPLQVDRRALRQVLLNVGSNAVKYGRAGGVVRLRASHPDAAEGGGTRIDVIDDGEGLSAEQIARLFQPFERLGRERGEQPGSGLGLVISRQLTQLMGGSLTLHSTPGAGTTARLWLPSAAPGA